MGFLKDYPFSFGSFHPNYCQSFSDRNQNRASSLYKFADIGYSRCWDFNGLFWILNAINPICEFKITVLLLNSLKHCLLLVSINDVQQELAPDIFIPEADNAIIIFFNLFFLANWIFLRKLKLQAVDFADRQRKDNVFPSLSWFAIIKTTCSCQNGVVIQ